MTGPSVIGGPPEHRDWEPWHKSYPPNVPLSVRVSPYVTVDSGIERPTEVGEGTLLLAKSHIGHDAIVGAGCEIATGAVIGGYAELGDGVKVGLNATVLPYRKIGNGARIGAGAVVTHDVPAGEVWAGVPARRLVRPEPRDPGKPERIG